MTSPVLTPSPPRPSPAKDSLLPKLDDARRAVVRTRVWIMVSLAIATWLSLIALMATLDYWLVLPHIVRVAWLVLTFIACGIGIARAYQLWIRPYSRSQVAAAIESHQPAYGQRVRTVADYEDPDAAPASAHQSLVHALRNQTHETTTNQDFEELPAKEPLTKSVAILCTVITICAVALLWNQEFLLAAGRTLLLPWHYTTVTFTPHQKVIKQGESVEIEAVVHGRPVVSARLHYRQSGTKKWKTIALEGEKPKQPLPSDHHPDRFHATLASLNNDLEFRVEAGPVELPHGHIQVLQPLLLERITAEVTPPEYLAGQTEKLELKDDLLKVNEGSSVSLTIELNRQPATVTLSRVNSDSQKDVQQSAESAAEHEKPISLRIAGQIASVGLSDLRQSITYSIDAKAQDGIIAEPQKIKIRVIPDNKPYVHFVRPAAQLEVTPTTEVALTLEASDDQGIHKVGILYQIGDGELQTLYEDDLAGVAEPHHAVRTLMLEDHKLSYQDQISYYAFAEDQYFGAPRRSVTPLCFIDIRPYKREFQQVEGGGTCNGCSLTLEELISRQRNHLGLAFAASQERNFESSAQQRLIINEQEILAATTEFADGLALRGNPVPELDTAIHKMEAALADLEKQNISSAVINEQQAVTALVSARKNLRQLLSQSSGSSASACRTFDRQQRQKLRTPEQHKNNEQQQVAEQRKQLNDLAKKQRQWSEEVRNGEKGAQLDSQQQSKSQASSSSSSSQSQQNQSMRTQQQSSEQLAQQQREMIEQLQQLAQKMAETSASSDTMKERSEQLATQMQRSLQLHQQQQSKAASQQSAETADELEHLADQLAAMNSQHLVDQVAQAQRTAQHLARREESMQQQLQPNTSPSTTPSSPAPRNSEADPSNTPADAELAAQQQGYATQAKMLADLLARLQSQAFEHGPSTQQALTEMTAANSPADTANEMQQAAEELRAGNRAEAAETVGQAAQELDEFAEQLRQLRSQFAQPQLEEMIALEQQIAQLIEQLSATGESQSGVSAEQLEAIGEQLESLAMDDQRMADALQHDNQNQNQIQNHNESQNNAQQSSQSASADGNPMGNVHQPGAHDVAPGFYRRDRLLDATGLRQINGVLQTKIQEMILAGALMDVNDAVPPQYKDLVEQYYRELSDDLRQ